MSEAKQISIEEHTEYLLKDRDTDIISSDGQLNGEFSPDLFDKTSSYILVISINPNTYGPANEIVIDSRSFLANTGSDINQEKKDLNTDILHAIIKTPFANKQSGNILKFEEKKKTRLLVKRGVAHISLLLKNIVLIYTKDKLVFAIDCDSKKYSIDKTLTELAKELDHSIFFRANRHYILNLNFIKSFKTYNKIKLLVDINVPELEKPVIISQLVAPAFKKWMEDA